MQLNLSQPTYSTIHLTPDVYVACIVKCRWEDNIKMDLQEVGGVRGDWMELAQDRDRWRALVGTVMNFRVP
jgi:hypothetical protein